MATTLKTHLSHIHTHTPEYIYFSLLIRFFFLSFYSSSSRFVKCSWAWLELFDVSQAICDFLQLHEWFVVTHKYWFDLRSALCFRASFVYAHRLSVHGSIECISAPHHRTAHRNSYRCILFCSYFWFNDFYKSIAERNGGFFCWSFVWLFLTNTNTHTHTVQAESEQNRRNGNHANRGKYFEVMQRTIRDHIWCVHVWQQSLKCGFTIEIQHFFQLVCHCSVHRDSMHFERSWS